MRNGSFDTINNAAIRGNRVYVSTRFNATLFPSRLGRLYAIDLVQNPRTGYSFEVAWFYQFMAPSGSSPTLGTVD